MTDREVGELWRDLQQVKAADLRGELYRETLTALIQKLVEERALRYYPTSNNKPWNAGIEIALREFHIPEDQFNARTQ